MIKKWLGNLFFKLFCSHLLVVIITLIVVSFFFSYMVERYFFSAQEWELTAQAEKVVEVLEEEVRRGSREEVKKIASALAVSMDKKIRVIYPPAETNEHMIEALPHEGEEETQIGLEQNEIEHVLQGNSLSKKLLGPDMQRLLIAFPLFQEPRDRELPPEKVGTVKNTEVETLISRGIEGEPGQEKEVIGAITVSSPLAGVEATIAQVSRLAIYSGIFATALAGVLAFSLAKTISNPIRVIIKSARELIKGNFHSRTDVKVGGELGELASTFNQAVNEIEKTVEEQKRLQNLQKNLIASASHEFRAPLTSIQGFVEAIKDGFVDNEEEKQKYLQVTLDNTLYLKRLVDDLLDLSSLESGNLQFRWEKIQPQALLQKAIDNIQQKALQTNIYLECKIDQELPWIYGDEDRLFQVLINLLENAIFYTPAEGTITISAVEGNNEIIFSVSDTGPGLPPQDLPYIWDRFYKVDKARNRAHKGKGLGLSIVKEIVRLHNGKVDVTSTEGKGTTFYVYLPTNSPYNA